MHRVVCHIRALVVLPTKELAQQVGLLWIQKSVFPALVVLVPLPPVLKSSVFAVEGATIYFRSMTDSFLQVSKVFNIYTDTTSLRVALVTGQKSLAKEQESLVQKT